jgi:hypothetical protein
MFVSKSRKMRWVGHTAHMGEMRYAHKILSENGRLRYRWEDRIRMELRKTGWKVIYWIRVT